MSDTGKNVMWEKHSSAEEVSNESILRKSRETLSEELARSVQESLSEDGQAGTSQEEILTAKERFHNFLNEYQINLKSCLLTALVSVLICILTYVLEIPNPNIILFVVMSYALTRFGYANGLVSGIVLILYSAFFFSEHHSLVDFTPINISKMIVIGVGVFLNIVLVGRLKYTDVKLKRELEEKNLELNKSLRKLEKMTYYDALTGLKNRFGFREDFETYFGSEVVVVMADVNHFKTVNDTYGHDIGDKVLHAYAEIFQKSFGKKTTYRYGGDEFLAVLKMTRIEFAMALDQYHALIRGLTIGETLDPFTASLGYASGFCRDGDDLRELIQKADRDMYRQKQRLD